MTCNDKPTRRTTRTNQQNENPEVIAAVIAMTSKLTVPTLMTTTELVQMPNRSQAVFLRTVRLGHDASFGEIGRRRNLSYGSPLGLGGPVCLLMNVSNLKPREVRQDLRLSGSPISFLQHDKIYVLVNRFVIPTVDAALCR